jgi:hypothetical protein
MVEAPEHVGNECIYFLVFRGRCNPVGTILLPKGNDRCGHSSAVGTLLSPGTKTSNFWMSLLKKIEHTLNWGSVYSIPYTIKPNNQNDDYRSN